MCNCMTWVRLPELFTNGGKLPPSDHHPDCEDYKLEEFYRIEYDGAHCIMEVREAAAMKSDDVDCEYTITPVKMTRDQFNKLEEFAGF